MDHELRFGVAFVPDVPWDEFVRRFLYIEELDPLKLCFEMYRRLQYP